MVGVQLVVFGRIASRERRRERASSKNLEAVTRPMLDGLGKDGEGLEGERAWMMKSQASFVMVW